MEETIKKRALCVDDDAINRMVMNHLLQPLGFQVDLAADGKKALELFQDGKYDIILLDIMMPEMDGFQTAAAIRANSPEHPPIVFVSAYSPDELEENMQKSNVQYFISKPLIKEKLYPLLDKLILN